MNAKLGHIDSKQCTQSSDVRCSTAALAAVFGRFPAVKAAYCNADFFVRSLSFPSQSLALFAAAAPTEHAHPSFLAGDPLNGPAFTSDVAGADLPTPWRRRWSHRLRLAMRHARLLHAALCAIGHVHAAAARLTGQALTQRSLATCPRRYVQVPDHSQAADLVGGRDEQRRGVQAGCRQPLQPERLLQHARVRSGVRFRWRSAVVRRPAPRAVTGRADRLIPDAGAWVQVPEL